MDSGKKRVIGGRLLEMFEGELKLVYQNGTLQKNNEHRHSCGGKVSLIIMSKETANAGAVLACDTCLWRYSFDPKLLGEGRRVDLHSKLFAEYRGVHPSRIKLTYYCIDCMIVPLDHEEKNDRCPSCAGKESARANRSDDLKK